MQNFNVLLLTKAFKIGNRRYVIKSSQNQEHKQSIRSSEILKIGCGSELSVRQVPLSDEIDVDYSDVPKLVSPYCTNQHVPTILELYMAFHTITL
jgi:hypothetical protein